MRPLIGALIIIITAFPARAAMPGNTLSAQTDLTKLSLEDLMNITVSIASRKEEKLSETAAAVFVITQEDIRRSGVTSIPEALRMVPGIEVARMNATNWAISIRGFNGRFANKLLVLMDGRTLYTPIYGGVYWDNQDTLLEDVEKIEVIRGPGAAIWGANAVNGIINIITKNAKDTQGGLLVGGAGNQERGFGALRYGGKVGEDLHYRAYVKGFKEDEFTQQSTGESAADKWHFSQSGARMDWNVSADDAITIQGDVHNGTAGEVAAISVPFAPFRIQLATDSDDYGLNVLGRWKHTWSETSDMVLQLYYDHTKSTIHYLDDFGMVVRTWDLDLHHHFQFLRNQEVTWGLGLRYISDAITNSSNIVYNPNSRDYRLFSAFLQDDITLIKDKLKVILGSKFEHNDFSGFEIQPNARFLWTPRERHAVWGAISRAVRTPSRTDHDLEAFYVATLPPNYAYPGSPVGLVPLVGNRDFDSEKLVAYELGYRFLPTDRVSIDIAAFYNDYNNLQTLEVGPLSFSGTAAAPLLVIPLVPQNGHLTGEAFGLETLVRFNPYPWWKMQASHTLLKSHQRVTDSTDPNPLRQEKSSPENQLSFRSSIDIGRNLEWDTTFRFTGNVPEWRIASYLEMDMRLAWRPTKNLELSLVGQNLLYDRHPEAKDDTFDGPVVEVPRSIYGKATLRF